MKTAEEILSELVGEQYLNNVEQYLKLASPKKAKEFIIKAMHEYARQMAEGFGDWLSKNEYRYDNLLDENKTLGWNYDHGDFYTTSELYTKYLEEIKQQL